MIEKTYNLAFTFHELGLLKNALWLKIRNLKPTLKSLRTVEKDQSYSKDCIRIHLTELKELGQQYNKVQHKMNAILGKMHRQNQIASKKLAILKGAC